MLTRDDEFWVIDFVKRPVISVNPPTGSFSNGIFDKPKGATYPNSITASSGVKIRGRGKAGDARNGPRSALSFFQKRQMVGITKNSRWLRMGH
jgi:hypothetical protein